MLSDPVMSVLLFKLDKSMSPKLHPDMPLTGTDSDSDSVEDDDDNDDGDDDEDEETET